MLKLMAYKWEYSFFPEIFEVMMDAAFHYGFDRIVRDLFDLCVHELKLKPSAAIIMPKLNSQAAEDPQPKRMFDLKQTQELVGAPGTENPNEKTLDAQIEAHDRLGRSQLVLKDVFSWQYHSIENMKRANKPKTEVKKQKKSGVMASIANFF